MLQFILGLFIGANVSLILYALILVGKRIYPNDTPYTINRTYTYSINGTEGMSQKGQYNNIINNNINNYKIDRLFNYILYKENEIPKEFIDVDYDEIIIALKIYDYSKQIGKFFFQQVLKESAEKQMVYNEYSL